MIYHVSPAGCDLHAGDAQHPFRTIGRAASLAAPGDTVQVHTGVYREWVDPRNGGLSDSVRITYEAAPGEKPVIKGSEAVSGWTKDRGSVWTKTIPNSFFGSFNPYAERIEGDWLLEPVAYDVHLGDVYVDGKSMYEARSLEEVYTAPVRTSGFQVPYRKEREPILHPEDTVYQWYAVVNEENTTLYCNFQEKDPSDHLIEINVRPCCFYPTQPGLNYITLRGFEIAQAACPFTPPTADQIGMVGAHWSKGWIIEDNILHDAKCSAISIGKDGLTGHNLHARFHRKPGYQYQMEAVFLGLRYGWSKENTGSHLIRNNTIFDCGQNAVVGHMGCAFSRIEHNHIYNIAVKHEFYGYEIAGVKLHAGIDVVIENNNFHHCTLGIWMDWQAQGVRITRNLFHHNQRDLMIEVTHGPCLVDNNLMLSDYAVENMAQGTAFVHNYVAGYFRHLTVLDRATPYHFPHSTQAAGCAVVYGGDDRMINNVMTGVIPAPKGDKNEFYSGGCVYDRFTVPEEFAPKIASYGRADIEKYYKVPQPVWVEGNAYAGHASPFRAEISPLRADGAAASLKEENGVWTLTLNVPASLTEARLPCVTTARLGMPRITEQPYDNPDGTDVDFAADYLHSRRVGDVIPGPFAALKAGTQEIQVWQNP